MLFSVLVLSTSTLVFGQQLQSNQQPHFEWGWTLPPPGHDAATTGQYYVKIPQAEYQVRYSADQTGYHGAVSVATNGDHHQHAASFALGQQAIDLLRDQEYPTIPENYLSNSSLVQSINYLQNSKENPVELFILQQQGVQDHSLENYISSNLQNPVENNGQQIYGSQGLYQPPNYINHQLYNSYPNINNVNLNQIQIPTNQNPNEQRKSLSSEPLVKKEETQEQNGDSIVQPVIQVFKDHNCTEDEAGIERFKAAFKNINGNFGRKINENPLLYRGTVQFKVDSPERNNARSERVLYSFDSTTASPNLDEGITKLVASTQDLISNEDLLTINHAAEKYIQNHNDDLIKPKSPYNLKNEQSNQNAINQQNRIILRAKLANVLGSEVVQNNSEKLLQTSSTEYKFGSPIVVDETYNNFKEDVVDNIVSTVAPYFEDGYEVTNVRNTVDNNKFMEVQQTLGAANKYNDYTTRPISNKYLAPITVALRLLNSNNSDIFNTLDDFEGSDSEFISKTVEPVKEKTTVEIQQSIPLSITHINDVEYHQQYLDEGKINDDLGNMVKKLLNRYVDTVETTEKNENFRTEGAMKDLPNDEETEEPLIPSENIRSVIEVRPNSIKDNIDKRREVIRFHNKHFPNKVIQPIVIEKEVPVTKYVDRFIEKEVLVPEPVEVIKEVPQPIVLPVPIEKIVEKPIEVTKYIQSPYPVQIPQPYPVEVKVPYPVENKIYIDRPVHYPYPIERLVEKQVLQPVPYPTPYAVPIEKKILFPVPYNNPVPVPYPVEKPVPYETIVEKQVPVPYEVEKRVPYPVPYETKVAVPVPFEKRVPVPYPVERIVEKPVEVTKIVEKPVHIKVPHPVAVPVKYPQPYPVEKIVEKRVPYPVPVDRVVEKKVPVEVPVEVEKIVHKYVEKPVVVTKYIDKPYPVETRVPYPVEKIVEKPIPYLVEVPVDVKVPYPTEKNVEKKVHVPYKVPYEDEEQSVPLKGHYSSLFPQYLRYLAEKRHLYNQKKNEKDSHSQKKKNDEIQSTPWGKHYASSYQYINNSNESRKTSLDRYIDYMNNQRSDYFGPAPLKSAVDSWNDHHEKLRRTDRVPKMSPFKLEYGFKPPLIPSTEIDLDGMPIKKEE